MALGWIQVLTEMSAKGISWGKCGRCVGLTNSPPSCANCIDIVGASNFWSPDGLVWVCKWIAFDRLALRPRGYACLCYTIVLPSTTKEISSEVLIKLSFVV
jgi:hypothetical protein